MLNKTSEEALPTGIEPVTFNITIDDIQDIIEKQNNMCVYTGRELVWEYSSENKPSIYRIDSDKGYEVDNIQLSIISANVAKNDISHDDFLKMIKDIYEYNFNN